MEVDAIFKSRQVCRIILLKVDLIFHYFTEKTGFSYIIGGGRRRKARIILLLGEKEMSDLGFVLNTN